MPWQGKAGFDGGQDHAHATQARRGARAGASSWLRLSRGCPARRLARPPPHGCVARSNTSRIVHGSFVHLVAGKRAKTCTRPARATFAPLLALSFGLRARKAGSYYPPGAPAPGAPASGAPAFRAHLFRCSIRVFRIWSRTRRPSVARPNGSRSPSASSSGTARESSIACAPSLPPAVRRFAARPAPPVRGLARLPTLLALPTRRFLSLAARPSRPASPGESPSRASCGGGGSWTTRWRRPGWRRPGSRASDRSPS